VAPYHSHTQFKVIQINLGKAQNFAIDLAKDGKAFCDIREILNTVYRDKTQKKAQIYRILKVVTVGKDDTNQHGRLKKKFFITPQLVASFAASVQAAKVMDHPPTGTHLTLHPQNLLFSKLKKELGGSP